MVVLVIVCCLPLQVWMSMARMCTKLMLMIAFDFVVDVLRDVNVLLPLVDGVLSGVQDVQDALEDVEDEMIAGNDGEVEVEQLDVLSRCHLEVVDNGPSMDLRSRVAQAENERLGKVSRQKPVPAAP